MSKFKTYRVIRKGWALVTQEWEIEASSKKAALQLARGTPSKKGEVISCSEVHEEDDRAPWSEEEYKAEKVKPRTCTNCGAPEGETRLGYTNLSPYSSICTDCVNKAIQNYR